MVRFATRVHVCGAQVDVDQDDTEVEQHEREQAKDQLRRYRGDVWDVRPQQWLQCW